MSDPFEKVKRFLARHSMMGGARGVVAAVSGGPDSVALLDMLARIINEGDGPDARLYVAHLDHGLRGQESADDAEFVRSLAERHQLPFLMSSVDVRKEASEKGRGIEETARELRYRFLLARARETGCDRIATGHTMTDQAETFLMRLVRGAGSRGLSGMRPVIPAHIFEESEEKDREAADDPSPSARRPLLIRPLLCITREEVEAYCRNRKLDYRVDATNRELDYTRNRVRSLVLPALAEINPRAVESLARAAGLAADDDDALNRIATSSLDKARVEDGPGEGGFAYSARAFIEQPPAVRRRMIAEAIKRLRSSWQEGQPSDQITSKHIKAVEELIQGARSGKRAGLPEGTEVWRDLDRIVFRQRSGSAYELELRGKRASVKASGLEIGVERGRSGSERKSAIEEAVRERDRVGRDWMMAVLDDCLLPDRMTVRPRRAGERAKVLGQRQTKKLKKLMIDHKIPSSRRELWPVVATPDGLYIWSPGLPPAQEFAARDETKGLAILRASYV